MARDPNIVLREIIDAIDTVIGLCANMNYEQFRGSKVEKLAVERAIEIISEAVRHLPQAELDKYPAVPWRQIRAMGNILRHEYHHLNDKIVWDVAREELPDLRAKLLAENPHLKERGDG